MTPRRKYLPCIKSAFDEAWEKYRIASDVKGLNYNGLKVDSAEFLMYFKCPKRESF